MDSDTEIGHIGELMERSAFYRECLAEREEILTLKWIESEKAGRDIGFDRALLQWVREHMEEWLSGRRKSRCQPDMSRRDEQFLGCN